MDISSFTTSESLLAYGMGCASGYAFCLASLVQIMKERIAEYVRTLEELTERVILLEEEIKNELRKQINN
jgi:hypothetical protein